MKPIESKILAPFQKKISEGNSSFDAEVGIPKLYIPEKKVWERSELTTVNKIRESDGYLVTSYTELVDLVAEVTLNNKQFDMFYRGQSNDYKSRSIANFGNVSKTTIYPKICRTEKENQRVSKKQITDRYNVLSKLVDLVKCGGHEIDSKFDEVYYALFQHYEIVKTPLIDITQSLRVASSFALKNKKKVGYLYVFGLPFPNQSISYFPDLEIVLIKLQNVVPKDALRPRYQEGFLVGKFPFESKKTMGDDLSRRLIAKFKLDNTKGRFWNKIFKPLPEDYLYPKNDKVEEYLKKYKLNLF